MRPRGRKRAGKRARHDDVLGLDHVDAMGERRAGQVGVEQAHDAADFGDAEPGRHEFRTVRHQQADRIAFGDALGERPARVLIGPRRERAIGEAFAV